MKTIDRPKAPLPVAERLPISAFVICMNEADYIVNCLLSLKICAEIVVVDSGSYDGTLEIIRTFVEAGWPIRLISQKWLGYARQKQFALEQCAHGVVASISIPTSGSMQRSGPNCQGSSPLRPTSWAGGCRVGPI